MNCGRSEPLLEGVSVGELYGTVLASRMDRRHPSHPQRGEGLGGKRQHPTHLSIGCPSKTQRKQQKDQEPQVALPARESRRPPSICWQNQQGAMKAHIYRGDLRDHRPLGSSKSRGRRLSKEVAGTSLRVPSAGSGEATRPICLLGALVRQSGTGTTE